MKLVTTTFSQSSPFQQHDYSSSKSFKRKIDRDEFKKFLGEDLIEHNEDLDEFKILLPKHGHFWDNGYEDVG